MGDQVVPGHLDEAAHVLGTIAKDIDYGGVHGLLACDPNLMAHHPDRRMEPEQRHHDLFEQSDEHVAALHMNQFMAYDRSLKPWR